MNPIREPDLARCRRAPRRRRIMVICGDTQVGLWVVRSLGRAGLKVFAVCKTPRGLAAHSRYAAGAWAIEHAPTQAGFADEVEQLARALDVGSILTISEGYHNALIRVRDRFEPEIAVLSPSRECFDRATDKDHMHALCTELGVPVARGMRLDELMTTPDALRFPLVLRTRNQNTGRGTAPFKAAYARNRAELDKLHARVEEIADNVIAQEYHPGAEDHVQVLMRDGRPFMVGEYIGEHHMPLAGGVTVRRVTCRHEELIRDAVRLLQAIEWEGIAGVQFHYDPRTDEYIFLEVNPRFIGGLPTVILAGFDAPFLLWQTRFEPEKMRRTRYRLGVRTRILGGDANWMLGMARGDELPPGQRRLSAPRAAASFLWHFGPWTLDDVFLVGDIRPFFVDWVEMFRRLGARSFDIIGNPDTGGTNA